MSIFSKVIVKVPKRNAFDLSEEAHLTCEFGQLIPTLCKEVIPGDKFKLHTESVVKLAPMLAPTMSRIDVFFHYFFVPNRLVYNNWENFITSGVTGLEPDGTKDVPVAPFIDFQKLVNSGYCKTKSLADYFGLPSHNPISSTAVLFQGVPPINAIPFLAYNKIYSDWFRDELLEAEEFEALGDGEIPQTEFDKFLSVKVRSWKKDYFTSARPDTQLGEPAKVNISGNLIADGPFRWKKSTPFNTYTTCFIAGDHQEQVEEPDGSTAYMAEPVFGTTYRDDNLLYYGEGISLQDASININDLRYALKLQTWLERNMRGGNRYIENILHHFGVKSSDARLQRSQFIGGRKVPVTVGEVLQTVDTTGNSQYGDSANPAGRRSGIAAASGRTQDISFFAEEHGFLICLMSILPRASYQQGIPRMFGDRWSRFGYAWPEFGNLGEQSVYNWELYVSPSSIGSTYKNDGTFGYQSRYSEYKTGFNRIHGDFRDTLNFWHNGRIFSNPPKLNKDFVTLNGNDPNSDGQNRIFSVTSSEHGSHFYCHLYHDVKVLRMLPKYGIPSI